MGKRGPAPEPNVLRVAKGTYRKDKHGDLSKEVMPPVGPLREPPKTLQKHGKEAWKRIGAELVQLRLLSDNDYETFFSLCETFDFEYKLTLEVKKDGMVVMSPKGLKVMHPALRMQREVIRDRNRLMRLFGMNPSDRSAAIVSSREDGECPAATSKIAARKRG